MIEDLDKLNWIEINLPWYVDYYDFENTNPKPEDPYHKIFQRILEKDPAIIALRKKLAQNKIDEYIDFQYDLFAYFQPLKIIEALLEKPELLPILNELASLGKTFKNSVISDPEYLEFKAKFDQWQIDFNNASFCGRKLNRPRTLIQMLYSKQIHLLGDFDANGKSTYCIDSESDGPCIGNGKIVWRYCYLGE